MLLKEAPHRFTDLQEKTKMSNRGLSLALTRLSVEGLVERLPDGRYALTEKGKEFVEQLEAVDLLELVIREKGAKKVFDALLKLRGELRDFGERRLEA